MSDNYDKLFQVLRNYDSGAFGEAERRSARLAAIDIIKGLRASDEPAPAPQPDGEREALRDELEAWAADITRVSYFNSARMKRICLLCNKALVDGHKHPDNDCLHERTRALREAQ